MKTVCINTYQRRPGIFKAVENENEIPVLVRKSVAGKWNTGHNPPAIRSAIASEFKLMLGDNVICEIIRDWQQREKTAAEVRAERRGRLLNWPSIPMTARRAA